MPIELVYDGKNLTIPKRMLPESGVPFEHHFKSTIGDNLIELAGRACYDSCKSEKTRASFDYHQHILDVNHGCYDDKTEVLTLNGWKFWKDVQSNELLCTLNVDSNIIEYQRPNSILKKEYKGDLIYIKDDKVVDIAVTPDHRMLAAPRIASRKWQYAFYTAASFLDRSYKIRTSGGLWGNTSVISNNDYMFGCLIGFFIGDGCKNPKRNSFHFRLKRKRKIKYLTEICTKLNIPINQHKTKDDDLFSCTIDLGSHKWLIQILKDCYNLEKDKQIPQYLLNYNITLLKGIFDGLIGSDGSIDRNGHILYTSKSLQLISNIQELALKLNLGFNTVVNQSNLFNIHFQEDTEHRIGFTKTERNREVTVRHYEGFIYCASVPNTTLFVKRNNKTCWSGNSVQEHLNTTIEFPMMNREINDFILWTCLNRPGVWVCGNPQTQNVRITANIRSIREWDKWNNNLVDPNVQSAVGVAMKRFGQQIAPMATADVSHGDAFPEAKLVEPIFPQEKWLSFYIYDVSRGCTHELVRHKWQTAISQRSTRYVDESESDWSWHPLILKYKDELNNLIQETQISAQQTYDKIVSIIQGGLIHKGVDKFTSLKQARGAARGVLGNALSTELIWSCSLAAALNIIKQRASSAADSEIRNLANGLYEIIQPLYPEYLSSFVKGECLDGIGYSLEMK